ncbi:ankyrin repeat-containing domain protein [Cercophora scortea]|uniref:Ankyrin repeat-containing domain protein n=1 Tax=Cercophora scortea TaxID=314031 RepID=A0AAE0J760_9PEZI|nr:ankyrin repeat-containing domain protein [Cercophora scortea]
MQISYAMVGDYLCAAILANDIVLLRSRLEDGWDANAACKRYGTPLQAAVIAGNEDMVRLLIDYGAKVKHLHADEGGQYGTPLIAAAHACRRSITKVLLHHGADVFASHPVHVNALYQAVGHSDYAITEMLLDHAAWLVANWREIRDLAAERGDAEINSLLDRYDIYKRSLYGRHRRRLVGPASNGRNPRYLRAPPTPSPSHSPDNHNTNETSHPDVIAQAASTAFLNGIHHSRHELVNNAHNNHPNGDHEQVSVTRHRSSSSPSSTSIVKSVVLKCLAVWTSSGNWKGTKGVAVVVAALDAGASLKILALLRAVIGPARDLFDALRRSDEMLEEERRRRAVEEEEVWGGGGGDANVDGDGDDVD